MVRGRQSSAAAAYCNFHHNSNKSRITCRVKPMVVATYRFLYAPANNPSTHRGAALLRQLGAYGLFRCDYYWVGCHIHAIHNASSARSVGVLSDLRGAEGRAAVWVGLSWGRTGRRLPRSSSQESPSLRRALHWRRSWPRYSGSSRGCRARSAASAPSADPGPPARPNRPETGSVADLPARRAGPLRPGGDRGHLLEDVPLRAAAVEERHHSSPVLH